MTYILPLFLLVLVQDADAVRTDLLVSTDWLENHLNDSALVIVHVSKGDSYDKGHIPGARLLKWEDFVVSRDGIPNELPSFDKLQEAVRNLGIKEGDHIVLYDEDGGVPAARAYFTFDTVGLGDRTSLLDGQLPRWKSEGRPLSQKSVNPEPSSIDLKINPNALASKEEVRGLISKPASNKKFKLIDSRGSAQYTGEQTKRGVARSGHIPGATNVPLSALLTDEATPVLRPAADLLGLYSGKGIRPGDEVVTYCNTGQSASHGYFVLKYLGYDPKLYDGSMSEWAADPDVPVATGTNP